MNGHHLILGKLDDFVTGEVLDDTLDERCRQKIARCLVEQKGFGKHELVPRYPLTVVAGACKAQIKIDLLVTVADRICVIVFFGPGSLVTRHRPALAISRLVVPYQVPLVVVTNGENAEVLDGATGVVQARGLEGLPSRSAIAHVSFTPLSSRQVEMEGRILYAYEIDDRCPCDEDICRLE